MTDTRELEVELREEHADAGHDARIDTCPVAIGIQEQAEHPALVSVGTAIVGRRFKETPHGLLVEGDVEETPLPSELRRWILRFDSRPLDSDLRVPLPYSFTVEVPA